MATLPELLQAREDIGLRQRVLMATVLVAETVRSEAVNTPNHTNRLLWARSVFINPHDASSAMMWAVLAQNNAFTFQQIINVNDATLQAACLAAVDVFALGA